MKTAFFLLSALATAGSAYADDSNLPPVVEDSLYQNSAPAPQSSWQQPPAAAPLPTLPPTNVYSPPGNFQTVTPPLESTELPLSTPQPSVPAFQPIPSPVESADLPFAAPTLQSPPATQVPLSAPPQLSTTPPVIDTNQGELEQIKNEMSDLKSKIREQETTINSLKRSTNTPAKATIITPKTTTLSPPVLNSSPKTVPRLKQPELPTKNSITAIRPAKTQTEAERYQTASSLLKQGSYAEAVSEFQALLKVYPKGKYAANAQYWLGVALMNKGDKTSAVHAFDKLARSYPKSEKVPEGLYKLGLILLTLNEKAKAKEYFDYVIHNYPGTHGALLAAKKKAEKKL